MRRGQSYPERSRNHWDTLWWKIIFEQNFIIFGRKMLNTTIQKYEKKIIRIGQESPDRPQHGLGTIGIQYGEKYLSTKNSLFSREIFFIIPNVCATRSRHFSNFQKHLLCRFKKILRDLSRKNNYAKINLPLSRNRQIKIEKSRIGPKFWRSKLTCPCIRITL